MGNFDLHCRSVVRMVINLSRANSLSNTFLGRRETTALFTLIRMSLKCMCCAQFLDDCTDGFGYPCALPLCLCPAYTRNAFCK